MKGPVGPALVRADLEESEREVLLCPSVLPGACLMLRRMGMCRAGAPQAGQGTLEYIGIIAAVALVVALVAGVMASPSTRTEVMDGVRTQVCLVAGDAGCEPGSTTAAGGTQDADSEEGDGQDGSAPDEGCKGFWGCTWRGLEHAGSGGYNLGKGAVDDVVGLVDVVKDPGSLIDGAKYIWDSPGDALKQLVWDEESTGMWAGDDQGGAVGRTLWNVGSMFIPGVGFAKAGSKGGQLGTLGKLGDLARLTRFSDEAADAARRAEQAVARGNLDAAKEAAEEARGKADEAAEEARKRGCPIAAGPSSPIVDGTTLARAVPGSVPESVSVPDSVPDSGGASAGGRIGTVAPLRMSPRPIHAAGTGDCGPAQEAAREADEAADRAALLVSRAGPGSFVPSTESMSQRAADFQAEATGTAPGLVYRVDGVDFDGFADGTLLEAKGPGYATFVKNGEFRPWFEGADGLVDQATRQLAAAKGAPVQWRVAEPAAAEAMRNLFAQNGITGITVVG